MQAQFQMDPVPAGTVFVLLYKQLEIGSFQLKKQRPYLLAYLKDGWLELGNNQAERSIESFVTDRKNLLFANTTGGDQGSAVIFSLIETVKENGQDPYCYLLYVLRTAPTLNRTKEDWVAPLLPANAPDDCRVSQRTN